MVRSRSAQEHQPVGPVRRWVAAAGLSALFLAGCSTPDDGGSPTGVADTRSAPGLPEVVAGISEEGLHARLEALAGATEGSDGHRAVGTTGYDRAADLVERELTAAGWSVEATPYEAATFVDEGGSVLEIGGRRFGDPDLRPLALTPAGDVSGPVVALGAEDGGTGRADLGCSADDYRDVPAGAVVLVPPGGCFRRAQLLAAQEAGAGAYVTSSPGVPDGVALRPTLARPDGLTIPGVWVSADAASALREAAGREPVRLVVTARTERQPTRSVLAELPGSRAGAVVMLGAHLDSVLDGPGIDDNGSGVAALLEIARSLGPTRRHATVRLALWSGEELGLHGSTHYVQGLSGEERRSIVVYLNADMVASPNGYAGVYDEPAAAQGSATATDLLRSAVVRYGGTPVPVDVHGSSDHYPFAEAGIPTGGVFSGALEPVTAQQAAASGATAGAPADACYHQACDDLDNVDLRLARVLTAALADVTVRLADDPDGLGAGRDG